jgi:NAD(P)-dependent dehydrogenase (short-subunit alcohol dehydrogenase family)
MSLAAEIQKLSELIRNRFGRLDGLFGNAAYGTQAAGGRPAACRIRGGAYHQSHRQFQIAMHAMARCLADVAVSAAADDPIRTLTREDEFALVNWNAEKYRQTLPTA